MATFNTVMVQMPFLSVGAGAGPTKPHSMMDIIMQAVMKALQNRSKLNDLNATVYGQKNVQNVPIAMSVTLEDGGTVNFPEGSEVEVDTDESTMQVAVTGTVVGTVTNAVESVIEDVGTYNELVSGQIKMVIAISATATSFDPFVATHNNRSTVSITSPEGLTITGLSDTDVNATVSSMDTLATLSEDFTNFDMLYEGIIHVTPEGKHNENCIVSSLNRCDNY